MKKTTEAPDNVAGDIGERDNLESVIALSGGDTSLTYRVVRKGKQVGVLEVQDLFKALVPTESTEGDTRSHY